MVDSIQFTVKYDEEEVKLWSIGSEVIEHPPPRQDQNVATFESGCTWGSHREQWLQIKLATLRVIETFPNTYHWMKDDGENATPGGRAA
jgi:hypothetical protein